MKYALAFVPVLAIGLSGQAIGGEKPVRLVQSLSVGHLYGQLQHAVSDLLEPMPGGGHRCAEPAGHQRRASDHTKPDRHPAKHPAGSVPPELHIATAVLLGDMPLGGVGPAPSDGGERRAEMAASAVDQARAFLRLAAAQQHDG